VAQAPFIVCNCAAIAESLFESELFGHVRGAFTGAIQDKEGFIERAAGGTIFLDEIGEIPLAAQAKLLRVIQNHEVQRLGARTVKTVDIRMIAASNRNLREAAGRKEFREDLYYRLATVELHMPPLTERKEDLPLLIQHFLKRFSEQYGKTGLKLTRRAEALLSRYSWPGNVRELENAMSYACMMVERDTIDLLDLPKSLRNQWLPWETAQLQEDGFLTLEELDRKYALSVLERLGGNHTRTADVLGIGRATLYRMLAERSPTPRAALGKPVPD
jgi:transcriptional regulator with PAS, ATPase and Fis domain